MVSLGLMLFAVVRPIFVQLSKSMRVSFLYIISGNARVDSADWPLQCCMVPVYSLGLFSRFGYKFSLLVFGLHSSTRRNDKCDMYLSVKRRARKCCVYFMFSDLADDVTPI